MDRSRDHGATKFTGCGSIGALKQPIEMRNIPKSSSECYFRNLSVSRIVEQITCASRNPSIVDVLANRAPGSSKELMHVAL
jgi:hypothetical protein